MFSKTCRNTVFGARFLRHWAMSKCLILLFIMVFLQWPFLESIITKKMDKKITTMDSWIVASEFCLGVSLAWRYIFAIYDAHYDAYVNVGSINNDIGGQHFFSSFWSLVWLHLLFGITCWLIASLLWDWSTNLFSHG